MLSTAHKILLARMAYRLVMVFRHPFGLSSKINTRRGGINWTLDISEGIDLAIYLMGGFEVRTLRLYADLVREGDVVLDVGANIGAHTLPLARYVGATGKVFAFEPTKYAFEKLNANICKNPELKTSVVARQVMLVSSTSESLPSTVYSSWPLDEVADLHNEHLGQLMATDGAVTTTLDQAVIDAGIDRVDFIKLDVDGNECKVIQGGLKTLERFRPLIHMELAPYVYADNPEEFDEMMDLLWRTGYVFKSINGRLLPQNPEKIRALIPEKGGINIIAKPE